VASLGGTFLRRRSDDAAAQLIRELEAQRVTQVVLGESHRAVWRRITGPSLVDTVLRRSHGVDVHVVADPRDRSV